MIELIEQWRAIGKLARLKTELQAAPIPVRNLAEVVDYLPTLSAGEGPKTLAFCDYDGVIRSPWYSPQDQARSLEALSRLAGHLRQFTLWSSRLAVVGEDSLDDSFSPFPYLTSGIMRQITALVQGGNPHCLVDFQIGPAKLIRGASDPRSLVYQGLGLLSQGETLIVIGSSAFDRARVRELAEIAYFEGISLEKFRFFDTGHLIL